MGVCASKKKYSKHQRMSTFESTISTNQTSEKTSSRTFSTIKKEKSNIILNRISEKTKYADINKTIKIKDIFLGKGVTGIIREGEDNQGNTYAIKSIWKNDIAKNIYFKREIEITLKCIHDNIIKCYEIYEDNTSIHLILELCNGGDLFDYIINSKNQKIEEEEAMNILEQILKALIYLHEEIGVIHRDIKPENFLIKNINGKNIIKLIDFGFSDYIPKNNDKFYEQ
jgi:calcium-dependent protein kinase